MKKGQLKIQQMAFMLLAVFLFFILVGLFYLGVRYKEIHEKATKLGEEKAGINALVLAESPEFSCGQYCVDSDRLLALKNISAYNEFWPFASIRVIKISDGPEKECNLGNYPDCNLFTIQDRKVSSSREASSFVALCRREKNEDYVYRKCEIGKVLIGYEVK